MNLFNKVYSKEEIMQEAHAAANNLSIEHNQNIPVEAEVKFTLSTDSKVYVELKFAREDEKGAKTYAALINAICTGELNEAIFDSLTTGLQENVYNHGFIDVLTRKWMKLEMEHDIEPVVSPSKALGIGWSKR